MMKVVRFRNNGDILRDAFVPQNFVNLVDNLLNENFPSLEYSPAADVLEKEKEYELQLMLPGFQKEDVKVELKDQKLIISGERKKAVQENIKFLVNESRYGKFSRSFSLPKDADTDNIQARFENGVLILGIARREEVQPKSIEIK